ncbi:endophilin-B1b isoform X3 [Paramormyrops kingsleyae]|uniref:endophilin-B1b isoform X3 n=1 Tax=Paramormyrops kingsleyae TaxID=1676925 RepID=UPI000CD5D8C4|nr:endophilin-B1-like isoform X3 [Paramormyrops kingsleyae]
MFPSCSTSRILQHRILQTQECRDFAEEKLGQAEKTELDVRLDNLLTKADTRRRWTERLIKQTEVVLQPNPGLRMEGLLYEMLEREAPRHTSNHEQLGECMIDAGHELGPGTAYGKVLIKCGEMEKQIGGTQRKLIQGVTVGFLTPLRNFIEWDSKTVLKEGRLLENRRLDLDAAKTRLKRAQIADAHHARLNSAPPPREEARAQFSYMFSFLHVKWMKMWTAEVVQAEAQLRKTQDDFDRQAEITRLLLEGISSTQENHLSCLKDFVEAQTAYYAQCHQYMVDIKKQLGSDKRLSSCPVTDATLPPLPEPAAHPTHLPPPSSAPSPQTGPSPAS